MRYHCTSSKYIIIKATNLFYLHCLVLLNNFPLGHNLKLWGELCPVKASPYRCTKESCVPLEYKVKCVLRRVEGALGELCPFRTSP